MEKWNESENDEQEDGAPVATEEKKEVVQVPAVRPPQQNAIVVNQGEIFGEMKQAVGVFQKDNILQKIATVAAKHMTPDVVARCALTAFSRNPTLLECTQGSVIKAVCESAKLGLDCSGLLGRGYLVPYKNGRLTKEAKRNVYEAQFMPGYLGLLDLARNSGEVVDVVARPVFKDEQFQITQGTNESIEHIPSMSEDQDRSRKNLQLVYAVAKFKNGTQHFEYCTLAEVEEHKKRSRAAGSGPWVTDYLAMALKTVLRKLCKFIPQSPELRQAMEQDNAIDAEYSVVPQPALPEPTEGRQNWNSQG